METKSETYTALSAILEELLGIWIVLDSSVDSQLKGSQVRIVIIVIGSFRITGIIPKSLKRGISGR